MKIKTIKIKNFLGIDEFEFNPKEINKFSGSKGIGKSSILEAIETAVTNQKRRTEVIKHGENESTLFVELDNGLEIDRRIRDGKSDYLKLKQSGEGIKSTEAELRKFLSGDIFRPLDFINLSSKEQTQIILNMINMNYSEEEIISWFEPNVLNGIVKEKHLLQVLKDIETKLYLERQEINREIKQLESQVRGIEQSLPDNYNGNDWKDVSIQEKYKKVSDAQAKNSEIENFELEVSESESKLYFKEKDFEAGCSTINARYKEIESDLKDTISVYNSEIEKLLDFISTSNEKIEIGKSKIDMELQEKISRLKADYELKKQDFEKEFLDSVSNTKELINEKKQTIASKETDVKNLSEKKNIEINSLKNKIDSEIESINSKKQLAEKFLKDNHKIDIDPIIKEAEFAETMKSCLNEWNRMISIKNGELQSKNFRSEQLTEFIETARTKPAELLLKHELPITGISVDENSQIRINGTLLDGLSDGEKLETAFKIAIQRIGDLKVICLDGFEKLNKTEQDKVISICEENEIQAFITITTESDNLIIE